MMTGVAVGGSTIPYGSESKGINFIGALTPGENFRFQVVANYLDGEYTDYDACVPYSNVVTGDGCAPIEGQQLQRQPKLRYMLTPSYRTADRVEARSRRTSPTPTSAITRRISPGCSSWVRTRPGISASRRTSATTGSFRCAART